MEKVQVVQELHRPARKNFSRRRTIIKGLNDLMQVDLMEFIPYARDNKGYKYILVAIDCFSKYVWTRPLKSKTGLEVTTAMSDILKHVVPKFIQSDDGKEFWNINFKKMCEKHGISMYSTYSTIKASIVERVIRTLKSILYKEFSLRGKYQWLNILQDITKRYNHKIHTTIGMKPVDVSKKNEKELLKTVYTHLKIAPKGPFQLNDIVRISKYKSIFDKSYTPNWSTELFKIIKIQVTNPVTYKLQDMNGQDIKGAFYQQELQKAKYPDVYLVEKVLRKKGNKSYIKWLGLDKSNNSWINTKDLL